MARKIHHWYVGHLFIPKEVLYQEQRNLFVLRTKEGSGGDRAKDGGSTSAIVDHPSCLWGAGGGRGTLRDTEKSHSNPRTSINKYI